MGDDEEIEAQWKADLSMLKEDIRALRGVVEGLRARLSAYESSGDAARMFAEACESMTHGLTTASPFEEKVKVLQALNVKVYAHQKGGIKLEISRGNLLDCTSGCSRRRARACSTSGATR